jgi:hypothetical protein
LNVGVLVIGRAATSLTQPDGVPPVAISLRYPALPVCTTLASARIGEMLLSVASINASISRGTANPPSPGVVPVTLFCSSPASMPRRR